MDFANHGSKWDFEGTPWQRFSNPITWRCRNLASMSEMGRTNRGFGLARFGPRAKFCICPKDGPMRLQIKNATTVGSDLSWGMPKTVVLVKTQCVLVPHYFCFFLSGWAVGGLPGGASLFSCLFVASSGE